MGWIALILAAVGCAIGVVRWDHGIGTAWGLVSLGAGGVAIAMVMAGAVAGRARERRVSPGPIALVLGASAMISVAYPIAALIGIGLALLPLLGELAG